MTQAYLSPAVAGIRRYKHADVVVRQLCAYISCKSKLCCGYRIGVISLSETTYTPYKYKWEEYEIVHNTELGSEAAQINQALWQFVHQSNSNAAFLTACSHVAPPSPPPRPVDLFCCLGLGGSANRRAMVFVMSVRGYLVPGDIPIHGGVGKCNPTTHNKECGGGCGGWW